MAVLRRPADMHLQLHAGLYLASAGQDEGVVVWDLQRKEVLVKHPTGNIALSDLSWRPESTANVLAGIGEDGQTWLWQDIIPKHMPKPAASLDEPVPSAALSAEDDAGAGLDDTGKKLSN